MTDSTHSAPEKRYEQLDHTADLRCRVYGRDMAGLFANAAYAMFDMMVDLSGVREAERFEVEASGADTEETLVNFLGELLYQYETRGQLCRSCRIEDITPSHVRASCAGETFDASRHETKSHIKAVTFHDVTIERAEGGLQVTLTFDA